MSDVLIVFGMIVVGCGGALVALTLGVVAGEFVWRLKIHYENWKHGRAQNKKGN